MNRSIARIAGIVGLLFASVGALGAQTATTFNFELLQARFCSFRRSLRAPEHPAGLTWIGCCIAGDPAGEIPMDTGKVACRFVGNVLCLDPGPNGDFASFALGGPPGTDPVIQGIKLIKTELY